MSARLQTKAERLKTYDRAVRYARGAIVTDDGCWSLSQQLASAWWHGYRAALRDARKQEQRP